MTPSPETASRRMLVPFLGILVAMLLAMLDGMIVGTAMPTIVEQLGGVDHLSWVVTAYLLASTVVAPIYGKLGDLFGHKKLFLFSIALFLLGSVLTGAAQNMGQLIAFRAIQGLGAGGLLVNGISLIGALMPLRERARFQGVSGAFMAAAMIGGPSLGGLITDHLSWRWAFYLNVPLGLVAIAVIVTTVHVQEQRRGHRIDYPGAALTAVVATALVLLVTWAGTRYAWASPHVLVLGVVLLLGTLALVAVERRASEPVLPLELFGARNLMLCVGLATVVGFVMLGAMNFLPLYQQVVQGVSATNSGLLILPMLAAQLGMSMLAGRLLARGGAFKPIMIVGALVSIGGAVLLSTLGAGTSEVAAAAFMAVLGVGLGLGWQLPTIVAQSSVGGHQIGVATGLVRFGQSIGGSVGVALAGAIFTRELRGAEPGDGTYVPRVADAVGDVFVWLLPAAVLGLVMACLLRGEKLRDRAVPASTSDSEPKDDTEPRDSGDGATKAPGEVLSSPASR